ncbi:hypothetical protein [Algoriphagus sp. A40]|uniref:hypothetical protein n=1 Tax=Algoriphagus sp. A40 TaxID=1945863 RepID=UPI000987C58E|nr:hypothetical protein [Algoriphagus sp. A40]OOG76739.1 hypothetical protein B0E43_07030 [Algoriphagus sp. A40]
MANLTSEQANQLSDDFFYLAMAIGDFRYANWERLTLEENKELSEIQGAILSCGEDILAFSTTLVMDEVGESLAKIRSITGEIRGTIKGLKSIQKGLDAASTILILGVAILKRDPMGIGNSIKDLFMVWKGSPE